MLDMVCAFYLLCGTGEGHIFSKASLKGLTSKPCPPAPPPNLQVYKFHKRNSQRWLGATFPNARNERQRTHSTQMAGSNWEPHPASGTPQPSMCALGEFDRRLLSRKSAAGRDEGFIKDHLLDRDADGT